MRIPRKRRRPLRLCALVVLSLGLLFPAGAANAMPAGTVVAWGCVGADFGQCSVPSDLSGVTAIAAGGYHSLALRSDGTVVAWGCGDDVDAGQCTVPSGLTGVTAIGGGETHSLALKTDGTVVAWGCGPTVALGNGDYGQCSVPTGLSGVTAIAAGAFDSLALKSDGTVVAWGCGGFTDFGQCNVPSGLSGVTAISAGYGHSLALKDDGTVVAWGCGPGHPSGCNVPSDLSSVSAIAAGFEFSLALKGDGTVVAWGCEPGSNFGQCSVPTGLTGVTAIGAGYYQSLAVKSDGTVVAWGCAADFIDRGQCIVPSELSGVKAVAGGLWQSLALAGAQNQPPNCSGVTATPNTLGRMTDKMALITLSGATDPDGDTLGYHIDGVTQDEYVTGVGDDTSPDAALTAAGANSNQVLVRSEANPLFNGRVYRVAYTVSDGRGGSCSGTAGPDATTTAKVGVPRKKGTTPVDDGAASSWDSFTGAPVQ
jgi:Regulator of chromosome condensation (RCC1) repeat